VGIIEVGRARALLPAAGRGVVAGLLGVAAMTTAEKVEQAITGRPNSYIPARALLALLGRRPSDDDKPSAWNHAVHWGTGAVLGALRGVWAAVGLRGAQAHVADTVVRLSADQTLENATGVGAPPRTWPREERALDVLHKAIYSVVTGVIAERLVKPDLQSRRREGAALMAHAARPGPGLLPPAVMLTGAMSGSRSWPQPSDHRGPISC
jgi:hypothetical protein